MLLSLLQMLVMMQATKKKRNNELLKLVVCEGGLLAQASRPPVLFEYGYDDISQIYIER